MTEILLNEHDVQHAKVLKKSSYGTISPENIGPSERQKQAKQIREDIMERAKEACDRLGGLAEIGNGFVIVDTRKFDIQMKQGTEDHEQEDRGSNDQGSNHQSPANGFAKGTA